MTYADLVEALIRREMGIVGAQQAVAVARQAGFRVAEDGSLLEGNVRMEDLDRLVRAFGERYGLVAVVGCKVALRRLAQQAKLELPDSLRH